MGADNLRSFHRWQRWRGIARLVPFVVIGKGSNMLIADEGFPGIVLAAVRPGLAMTLVEAREKTFWAIKAAGALQAEIQVL